MTMTVHDSDSAWQRLNVLTVTVTVTLMSKRVSQPYEDR
jgi:hypothetical protein